MDKVRIRFRKEGGLRLLSHHDVMRSFERMLRRAALPFRSTGGFHPTPRLVFASSLPLGVVGLAEVAEIEFTEPIDPEEVLVKLQNIAPAGITFFSAKRIEMRLSGRAHRGLYRLPLGEESPENRSAQIAEKCQQLLAAPVLWVEREKPKRRRINIRPFIDALRLVPGYLEMDLWITQEGTARADEVVRALGLSTLLDQGYVLERTYLEIADELDPKDAAKGPTLPDRALPNLLKEPLEGPADNRLTNTQAPTVHWGASPNGPIVE
jgi:radical SAM-linked protein